MDMLSTVLADLQGWLHWLQSRGFLVGVPFPRTALVTWAVVSLALAALPMAFLAWRSARPSERSGAISLRRGFTQQHGTLCMRLAAVVPDQVVQMQVPLSRFLHWRQDGGPRRDRRAFDALVADYVVFRPDGSVTGVIVLDEPTLPISARQRRWRASLLERAGLRVMTWQLQPMPSVESIGAQMNPAGQSMVAAEPGPSQRTPPVAPRWI